MQRVKQRKRRFTTTQGGTMEENNLNNVDETLQSEQQDTEFEEQPEVVEETAKEVEPKPKKSSSQEINIRELRNAKEKAEREREMLLQKLYQYESKKEDSNQDILYGDNDFIEGKHLKKEIESVKKQLRSYEQQVLQQTDEMKLKAKYPDFENVVTSDMIERLKEADPEFSETIAMSQSSLYSRGASVYKRIKEMGLYQEDKYQQEKETIHKNNAKPRSINSISPARGDSPLSMANAFANGLTSELKQQLWKEVQDSAKRGR